MSWDFAADDLRKELKELKEKLAVQGVKVGEQETKILKNEEELRATKDNYADVLNKLRKEADRALELDEALKKRTGELRNERYLRENVEKALRTAKEEREMEAASVRETQHYLSQTATESNEHREHREKLAAEKMKLEAQIRELQAELQRRPVFQPAPPKTPARPRASSLTNLNKVVMLERDIEQIRASASTSELELKSTQEKLSKLQSDLMRAENEKEALEKKFRDHEQLVKDTLVEKDELQAEVDFYRKQNASGSREEELLARLEEEEAKSALFEQQLAQASRTSTSRRSVDQLHARLNDEVSRREAVEAREIHLVQEREEALNEIDELRRTLQNLEGSIGQKDLRIVELETQCRELQHELQASRKHPASDPMRMDGHDITDMVNRIERIRAERDELKAHLEFVQMEAHFKVEALEKNLAEQTASTADETQLTTHEVLNARLSSELNDEQQHILKLQTAASALVVTIQHLHAQNELLRRHVAIDSPQDSTMLGDTTYGASSSRDSLICELQERLRVKTNEVDHIAAEHRSALSNNEAMSEFELRLSDTTIALREEREIRSTLEEQVRQLEVNLNTVKENLADTLEHCERLKTRQTSEASSDAVTRSLKNEIEELRSRVMRRTEQIGLQQHDIKRLETNMRLTDERLEEVLGELEMAETAKAAMLEDCSTAREERDQAKEALIQSELEIERLSARLQQVGDEANELRASLKSLEETEKMAGVSKDHDLSAMTEAIVERDGRIQSLMKSLDASEAALRTAREEAISLRQEVETVQEASKRSVEELQSQMQSDKAATLVDLEHRTNELHSLSKEVEVSKVAVVDAENALEAKNEECERALNEIGVLTSQLEVMKTASQNSIGLQEPKDRAETSDTANAESLTSELAEEIAAHQETRKTLFTKEAEFKQKMDELHQLSLELVTAKASQEDSSRMLESKEKELESSSAELKRLTSQLELNDAKQQKDVALLESREKQLLEMEGMLSRLETEKAELINRLAVFEVDAEKELTNSASLHSILEEERKQHEVQIRRLEADLVAVHREEEERLRASESFDKDLSIRHEETLALLETTREELREKQALYGSLVDEQKKESASREEEVADLNKQLAGLSAEIEVLRRSLEEEIDGRKQELAAHEEELQAALDKHESLSAVESELRRDAQKYQGQLADVRANLMALQDENTSLQSEIDNISGECQRAKFSSQSLEKQLASNSREISDLRDELSHLREALSQSEKSGKTAEMSLLLISQQNERTISSLRNKRKEHEKDAERIQKLQQIVGETKEQISEMEGLLRAKCAEIEDNDDKFIQLLKEKKKLTAKIESLTKKNNNLQNKLSSSVAVASPRPPRESTTHLGAFSEPIQSGPTFPTPTPVALSETPVHPAAKPRISDRMIPSQPEIPKETRRISGSKRRRESTPPLDEIPVKSSIGKKRPLPDDSEQGRAPVEARFPNTQMVASTSSSSSIASASSSSQTPSLPSTSEFTSTPRRRPAPRSGFTPVRGQAALRPTLSQPSPVRRSAAAQILQSQTVISDVTNSPPRSKRVFTAEPGSSEPRVQKPAGKGWLGKIRGGTNPLLRTRQQPKTENHS